MEDPISGPSAVADAPASTTSTPASPVTSPTEKPSSFAEALTARLAAPVPAEPGAPTPAGEPPAPATAAPPQTPPPVETVPTADPKGPIPFDRHESILKNARAKTEAEVSQRFQQQYAPHVELGQRIQADAIGTVVGLVEGLANHPDYGPQMISALARTLGSRRGQPSHASEEPQADLQTADGTLVYSAPQQAKREAWLRQQWLGEVDERLQPLQQREQTHQAQEKARVARQGAHDAMSKVVAPYLQIPEFVEHRPAITAKWQALVADGADAVNALGLAFTSVLRETVLPSRTAHSQQQLTATAVQKSLGSTSGPGAAPAAPAGRPKSFEEGFSRVRV